MNYSLLPLVIAIGVALPSLANSTEHKIHAVEAHKMPINTTAPIKGTTKKSASRAPAKAKYKVHKHVHRAKASKKRLPSHHKAGRKSRRPQFRVVDAIMDPTSLLVGTASYYGGAFQGKKTASGERFNQHILTAAHRTIPLNSLVEVTNLKNNKKVIVRINDRGPWIKSRIIDLSKASADAIGISGIAQVSLKVLQ